MSKQKQGQTCPKASASALCVYWELCELYLPVNFTVGKIDVTINCRPKLSLHGVVLLTGWGVEEARVYSIHHMLQRRRVIFNGGTCQDSTRGSKRARENPDLKKVSESEWARQKKGIKLITDIINAPTTTEIYNKNVNLKCSRTKKDKATNAKSSYKLAWKIMSSEMIQPWANC